MKLIGIGGTNGSGKDTLSEMLAQDYGWLFISSSRDLIIPELKRLGRPPERDQMAALTAEWRRQSGDGAVVERAMTKFKAENKSGKYKGLVISSIRHPWEVEKIHELGGILVWIDANPHIRYDRIFMRGHGRKDQKSFQEFLAEEQAEQHHTQDQATLSWQAVKDQADISITNDTDKLDSFKKIAKKALSKFL